MIVYLCILDAPKNGLFDETTQEQTSKRLNERNLAFIEMTRSAEFTDKLQQNVDIYGTLKSELETLRAKFPQQFQKPIYVLSSVDLNMKDQ